MSKLLILSILMMMIAIPVRFSRTRNAGVGLRRTLTGFFIYNVICCLAVDGEDERSGIARSWSVVGGVAKGAEKSA